MLSEAARACHMSTMQADSRPSSKRQTRQYDNYLQVHVKAPAAARALVHHELNVSAEHVLRPEDNTEHQRLLGAHNLGVGGRDLHRSEGASHSTGRVSHVAAVDTVCTATAGYQDRFDHHCVRCHNQSHFAASYPHRPLSSTANVL